MAVGTGLAVLGVTVYAFLVLAARALGPERYSALSAMWALVFLSCGGFFLPVEQQLTGAVVRLQSKGTGIGALVKKTAVAASVLVAGMAGILAALGERIVGELFDGQWLVLVGLLLSLAGYGLQYIVRGVLAGRGQFVPYGRILATEGVLRLAATAVMVVLGVQTAGPLALVVGLTPLVAVAPVVLGRGMSFTPGPEPSWGQLSRSLGYLLIGSLLAQVLIHVGPVVVKVLSDEGADEVTGRFFAGLLLTRAPLFLFLVVQASLLPRLAALFDGGHRMQFSRTVSGSVGATVLFGMGCLVGVFFFGRGAVSILFGAGFLLDSGDLVLLSASTSTIMVALVLVQALLAMERHREVAISWLIGVVAFVLVVVIGSDPVLRVELGLLIGSAAAVCGAAAFLRRTGALWPGQ